MPPDQFAIKENKNHSNNTNIDYEKIEEEFRQIINKHSIENVSNTPDFILAKYLMNCLKIFNDITNIRDDWKSLL